MHFLFRFTRSDLAQLLCTVTGVEGGEGRGGGGLHPFSEG